MSIESTAKALNTVYGLVLSCHDEDSGLLVPYAKARFDFDLACHADVHLSEWLEHRKNTFTPEVYISDINHVWAAFCCNGTTLVVGPCLLDAKSNDSLPVLPYFEFVRVVSMLICSLLNTEIEPVFASFCLSETIVMTEEKLYDSQHRDFKSSYVAESHLRESVRTGNLKQLGRLQNFTIPTPSVHSSDSLRNSKILFIISATLITRAAIDGGLPVEIAYPLSDMYLAHCERISSVAGMWELLQKCATDFTRRVSKNNISERYSLLVSRTCGYILANIGENIKVNDVAAEMGVSAEHLCRAFKKETGCTVLEFIQRSKIDEAKILLRFSELSLAEISARLSFASQSQFTTLFKRLTGNTPGQYRTHRA